MVSPIISRVKFFFAIKFFFQDFLSEKIALIAQYAHKEISIDFHTSRGEWGEGHPHNSSYISSFKMKLYLRQYSEGP